MLTNIIKDFKLISKNYFLIFIYIYFIIISLNSSLRNLIMDISYRVNTLKWIPINEYPMKYSIHIVDDSIYETINLIPYFFNYTEMSAFIFFSTFNRFNLQLFGLLSVYLVTIEYDNGLIKEKCAVKGLNRFYFQKIVTLLLLSLTFIIICYLLSIFPLLYIDDKISFDLNLYAIPFKITVNRILPYVVISTVILLLYSIIQFNIAILFQNTLLSNIFALVSPVVLSEVLQESHINYYRKLEILNIKLYDYYSLITKIHFINDPLFDSNNILYLLLYFLIIIAILFICSRTRLKSYLVKKI